MTPTDYVHTERYLYFTFATDSQSFLFSLELYCNIHLRFAYHTVNILSPKEASATSLVATIAQWDPSEPRPHLQALTPLRSLMTSGRIWQYRKNKWNIFGTVNISIVRHIKAGTAKKYEMRSKRQDSLVLVVNISASLSLKRAIWISNRKTHLQITEISVQSVVFRMLWLLVTLLYSPTASDK